jgi:ferredoxin
MNAYNNLFMYYFSGTGNSKQVASWVVEVANQKQVAAELIDISKTDRRNIPQPPANALVGFCSPTHGFNYPPVMVKFIFRFPRATQNNRVFLMNTRAGMKLSKLFLPGLSGLALLLAALVLLLKGYKIAGMRSIDLPSNWISLHPGLKQKVVESLFSKYKKETTGIAEKILGGKRCFRALWFLPIDLLIAPIGVLYYFIGRFFLAKTFYASRACNNCGVCIKQCPVSAIRLVDNRPYWSYKCESCMHCMNICPERAIETAHGFIIGLLILLSTLIQVFVYKWFLNQDILWFSDEARFGWLWRFIFETTIGFAALFTSYWMVHYLRRIKVFDLLITYTSLTFYKFWRRYKPTKAIKQTYVPK